MTAKRLIVIAGPTAVGKTDLAIKVAQHLDTEIINADSRQIYHEMVIGTAVPSTEQLAMVKHHLIKHKSIHDYYNASLFEQEAIAAITLLFRKNDYVILTGGSGLYIDAVCRGIDDLPSVDLSIRESLHNEFLKVGLAGIQARLYETDPDYYGKVDLNNPKRILKALEIAEMTGRTYTSFLTGRAKAREFVVMKIGLDIPRAELHHRINTRVKDMLARGLLQEVENLRDFRNLNALNTVGYKELFEYLDGKCSLEDALGHIGAHTRQYARRQVTWFRKDRAMQWFTPDALQDILSFIQQESKKNGTEGNQTF